MKRSDLIDTMASFIGISENPPGSNRTPIGEEYGFNGVAWCAETISIACTRLGFPLHEAAVIRIEQRAKAGYQGMSWSATPVVGSAACFDFGRRGNWGDMHTGVVTEVLGNGRFRTIEGNHQDRCDRVLRDMTYVRGFAVFPFEDANAPAPPPPTPPAPVGPNEPMLRLGSTGDAVRQVQTIIQTKAGGNCAIDGVFGPHTEARVRDIQRFFTLTVDGVVGAQTWDALNQLAARPNDTRIPPPPPPNLYGGHPHENKPLIKYGARGAIVTYLQQVISDKAGGNIGVDGIFGNQTLLRVKDVQRDHQVGVDGIVGPQTWAIIDRLALS